MLSYITISAFMFVLGVYLCDALPYQALFLLIIFFLASSVFLKKYRKMLIIGSLMFSLGAADYLFATQYKQKAYKDLENEYVTIIGTVYDIPEKNGDLYSYKVRTNKLVRNDKVYERKITVKVTAEKEYKCGDGISAEGFLEEMSEKSNSTDFNSKRYYQSRGIFTRLYAQSSEYFKTKPEFSIPFYINRYKSRLSDEIDLKYGEDESAIIKAVFLGNKNSFTDDYEDSINKTGFSHYIYSSYIHLILMAYFVNFFFGGIKKGKRDIILCVLAAFYIFANFTVAASLKNGIALIIGLVFLAIFGFSHYLDVICATLLLICIINPLYCFETGAVMSVAFGVTIHYYREIGEKWLGFIKNKTIRYFITYYIIVTLILMPLTCYFFNGFNPFTALLFPFFTIVCGEMLCCSAMSAFFGLGFFDKICDSLLWYYTDFMRIYARLPLCKIWIKSPSVMFLIAYFITLYLIYQAFKGNLSKNTVVIAICMGMWTVEIGSAISDIGKCRVEFVNVGQGDGAVIKCPDGKVVIVDGGGISAGGSYDSGKNRFLPYLTHNGYTKIDKAIVSHYHSDHCMGVIDTAVDLDINELVLPDVEPNNEYRIALEKIAKIKNIKVTYASKGDVIDLGDGMTLDVLWPESGTEITENDSSLVVGMNYKDFSCLFTGDIGKDIEDELIDKIGKYDIVKMAHHGSANSSKREFTEKVSPDYAVASVGKDNIYQFPKDEAVYNYQQSGAKVLRTDENGEIIFEINKDGSYRVYRLLNR